MLFAKWPASKAAPMNIFIFKGVIKKNPSSLLLYDCKKRVSSSCPGETPAWHLSASGAACWQTQETCQEVFDLDQLHFKQGTGKEVSVCAP
jgi:hypothetical protein